MINKMILEKDMILEKGMIISTDNWWYVVVNVFYEDGKTYLNCICDNANNVYTWDASAVHTYMTLKEIANKPWDGFDRIISDDLRNRPIPYMVIVEVLAGRHDKRF